MDRARESRPVRQGLLRGGLLFLAITPLVGGLWALLVPRTFYEDFPLPGRYWISTLGPYNEHLVRDYGALNLALAVLLVSAAILLKRHLAPVALVTWLVYATPHFVFHLGKTHHFSAQSNVEQLVGLGLLVVLPLVLLFFALPYGAKEGLDDVERSER
jgi:hypothetical protein